MSRTPLSRGRGTSEVKTGQLALVLIQSGLNPRRPSFSEHVLHAVSSPLVPFDGAIVVIFGLFNVPHTEGIEYPEYTQYGL